MGLLLFDGGSVLAMNFIVPDDTSAAGKAAATAVEELPTDEQAVTIAFAAAQTAGTENSLRIHRRGFRLFPDGRVTLTASREAPTLVFEHLPWLRELTDISATTTEEPQPFS
jgi:hypothetical protein